MSRTKACTRNNTPPLTPFQEGRGFHARHAPGSCLTLYGCPETDLVHEMRKNILEGMSMPQKTIPSKYLYDAYGSLLFDEICCLPEYYLTRTELAIIEEHAPRIMEFFSKEGGSLVEIGSGSDLKVSMLFKALSENHLGPIRYVPFDISESGIRDSASSLQKDFPDLIIEAIVGDFTRHLHFLPPGRKLICFLGSTLGNFCSDDASTMLKQISRLMGFEDRLLLGLDMLKPVDIIEAAYNDSSGTTARFNLNVLSHINERLGADFRLGDFSHVAFFNPQKDQVEMHLEARRTVTAFINDIRLPVYMREGETIHTEISRKFGRQGAEKMFMEAGLSVGAWYTDSDSWFSLIELEKADLT